MKKKIKRQLREIIKTMENRTDHFKILLNNLEEDRLCADTDAVYAILKYRQSEEAMQRELSQDDASRVRKIDPDYIFPYMGEAAP